MTMIKGDSGGPVTDAEGYLIGIVSWGKQSCTVGGPSVFAQTDYFLDWIAKNSK